MLLFAALLALALLLHDGALALASEPVFDPNPAAHAPQPRTRWVAPHAETPFWTGASPDASRSGMARQWAPLLVSGEAVRGRLPVWDMAERHISWVTSRDVGPIDPRLVGSAFLPPVGRKVAWTGPARITMYTCVELGGHDARRRPEPGGRRVAAVDPSVIPLGSTVWVQGLGTFLAADTGSLVRGAHLDVFSLDYGEALAWGVQERSIFVFEPD